MTIPRHCQAGNVFRTVAAGLHQAWKVAQSSTLLYRRLPVGKASGSPPRWTFTRARDNSPQADFQSISNPQAVETAVAPASEISATPAPRKGVLSIVNTAFSSRANKANGRDASSCPSPSARQSMKASSSSPGAVAKQFSLLRRTLASAFQFLLLPAQTLEFFPDQPVRLRFG
jgi:hypothetical protein